MKVFFGVAVLVAACGIQSSHVEAQNKTWTCSAPGLVSGSYDGGSSAYIHLQGFPSGGSYPVSRSGKTATGTTQNGTKFTCRLS